MTDSVQNRIDLSGRWFLMWADGERGGLEHHAAISTDLSKWIEARVPGEVHLDLMEAGLLEEPSEGTNCLTARWVEECYWSYRKTFTAPDEALRCASWLILEGLDYHAKIFLNGELAGEHSNFFRPCKIRVDGKLRRGENVLVVELESGLFSAAEKTARGYYGMERVNALLHKRIWLRKPQCSFGWDWAPRLINVGIHKPVGLEWSDSARWDDFVIFSELKDDFSEGLITARFFIEGVSEEKQRGEIAVRIEETGQEFRRDVDIGEGIQAPELKCSVSSPRLWWPLGQGEQPLYTIRAEFRINGVSAGERIKKTGFRKVKIDQSPHPDRGRYFVIEVNGRKIFAKGANLVPSDIIYARIDRKRYEVLVDRALEANFNFLRVWGGGLYESGDFYELCDEKGIMVWQDFMFACGGYPATDENFMGNVKEEAVFNVRRLAGHPSLVIWCGNNEQEWHTFNQDKGVLYPDYSLYHLVLPRILKQEDPTVYYQPSSPLSPDYEFPNDDYSGDQHPWSVGFENVDFRDYREMECRFPNEGGILGPVSISTMHSCLSQGQKHINSFSWQIHDNAVEDWYQFSVSARMMDEWLGLDPGKMTLEDYVYYAGLVQGEGLREYIDNFRRRKFDSASAIFWMFNDCWPATRSWSIIDSRMNRNPSFYPVKRAFSPVAAAVVRDGRDVKVFGINDTEKNWRGELRFGLFSLAGEYMMDEKQEVEIPANSSECLSRFNASAWDEFGVKKSIAFAMLERNGCFCARNRLFLPRFREMEWSEARVEVSREGSEVVFRSEVFAWGGCIDLSGEKLLADNFFDVWPGIEYRISWDEGCELPQVIKTGNLVG